jgi:hypothetical protein
MKLDGFDPTEWLLISNKTLKELDKKAAADDLCEPSLAQAQDVLNKCVKANNAVDKEKFELEQRIYKLEVDNYNLNNPPWYKTVYFWGVTGVVGGLAIAVALGR